MLETKEEMGGQQLSHDEIFRFACGPELRCFNTCCRNKHLPLWPYDVLRLRRALDLPSYEILETYAELEFDPHSGWPSLRLRLNQDGYCPLVTPEGCRVYPHRPAACRLFPLVRAAAPGQSAEAPEVLFLRQETKGCLGWEQDREHTCGTWVADQELEQYNLANDQLLPLFFHTKRPKRMQLDPKQIHGVIAALYNLDVFRPMAAQPEFRKKHGTARVEKALKSDEELLLLGRDFLLDELFGEENG